MRQNNSPDSPPHFHLVRKEEEGISGMASCTYMELFQIRAEIKCSSAEGKSKQNRKQRHVFLQALRCFKERKRMGYKALHA